MLTYILFIAQIIILFFISRITIRELFFAFRWIFKKEKIVFTLITLVFLPGTIIHELSHFFMAIILFMRVRDITVIPTWEGNYIKLGRVLYEKADFVRGFIVGIAPLFGGLFFLWLLSYFHIFPQHNFFLNILLVYLIFSISTSMFSSRQDLVDAIYMIPLIILIGVFIYVFNINVVALFNSNHSFTTSVEGVIEAINMYAFYTVCIHLILIVLLRVLRMKFKYA